MKEFVRLLCWVVIGLPVLGAILTLAVALFALLLAVLGGKAFVLVPPELDYVRWSVLALVVLGPIAYKMRNYLDP